MAEYIKRDEIYDLSFYIPNPKGPGRIEVVDVDDVDNIPAADVVEVVRCLECVFNEDKGKKQFYQWCCQSNKYRPSNWFCADGMREEVVGDV